MANFIVTFMPEGESTVDKLIVVAAWSSTSKSLPTARSHMLRDIAEDRHGIYAKHGKGVFTVALQGGSQYV